MWIVAIAWLLCATTACSDADTAVRTGTTAGKGGFDGYGGDLGIKFQDVFVADGGGGAGDAIDAAAPSATCGVAGSSWCPCKTNSDCDGNLCLDMPDGHVCAKPCTDLCPQGYTCAPVGGGSDIVNVCVPKWGWLCDPCLSNGDCQSPGNGAQAACIDYGAVGHFCGFDCAIDGDCPSGYVCGEGKTVEGATRKQCWFGTAAASAATQCDCSVRATTLQLETACWAVDGTSGAKCGGSRHCGADGLDACSGKPGKEVCNGKDDDCDGQTDDLACDDNNACTQDLCDPGKGECSHPTLDGSPCNADNTDCTKNDTCQGGKCTAGPGKTCSDGNPCTDDACDPKTGCTFANNSTGCEDGKICTTGDYCGDGTCHAGKISTCDDGNSCTDQVCDTKTGNCNTTFNALNCDDGNSCSKNDACSGGVCKAGTTVDCNDNDACTVDSCDGGNGCKHSVSKGVCDDGDACSYGETCSTGACTGGTNLNCDDQNACTADSCDKTNGCVHTAQNGACSDANECTVNDSCTGGACVGQAAPPCTSDGNLCTDDTCDPTLGCIYSNNALPCTDGSVCTTGDSCAAGKCVSGSPMNCASDGNPCTTESCNPVSGCESINNSVACNDGDACTEGDKCSGGKCQAGAPKNCSTFSGVCGDGLCSNGACYAKPFAIETACPTGLCDGAGTCVTPQTYTVDGCNGANFQNCSTWNCFGCLLENGFSAYNTTDCEETGCFDRFPSFGQSGFLIMEAQWANTAYVKWQFPKTLIGKYKIEAFIPPAIPASANGGTCPANSTTTYAKNAIYHLQTAGNDLTTKTVDHQAAKGTKVTLYQGNATGLKSIQLGNGPNAVKPPACQFYLVDAIVATPY